MGCTNRANTRLREWMNIKGNADEKQILMYHYHPVACT